MLVYDGWIMIRRSVGSRSTIFLGYHVVGMDLNECGLILLGLLGRRWMVVIYIKFREGIGVVGCSFNRFLLFG